MCVVLFCATHKTDPTQTRISFEVKISADKIIANGKAKEELDGEMFRQALTESEEQSSQHQ